MHLEMATTYTELNAEPSPNSKATLQEATLQR